MQKILPFLATNKGKVINSKNELVFLKGINLGGWLMMEGYILGGRNIPEKSFKKEIIDTLGEKNLQDLIEKFRNNFIVNEDFCLIKKLGFNCIRLPFNHSILKEKNGIKLLSQAVAACESNGLYCILDMHAAPGCQNGDWHSDSSGEAALWEGKAYKEDFFELWEELSDTFKDRSSVAGYDLLNEPVIKDNPNKALQTFYKEAVRRIRQIDKKHIIFLEGNLWSQDLESIGEPFSDNLSYSIHYYRPLDFTHNFKDNLIYPGNIQGEDWNKLRIKHDMAYYNDFSEKHQIPILLGEFGVNSKYTIQNGSLIWLEDVLSVITELGFHWTYWTYKTIANKLFPDGIYRYDENKPWINTEGPVSGWENYHIYWKALEKEIIDSWKTVNFKEDAPLSNLLVKYLHL